MPKLTMFHPEAAGASGAVPPPATAITDSLPAPSAVAVRRTAPHMTERAAKRGRGDSNNANPFVEVAARLLSETAHDLRAPLTSVRELVRLVRDEHVGSTTEMQREMLDEALGQCDAMASLVDNMLQLDRLRSGLPRTRRRWILPTAIPPAVDVAVLSLAAGRGVRVCWDGFDGRHGPLFADEQLIVRLLINLIGNAIAVSEEERNVLVRLRASEEGLATISVCDHGPGLAADDLAGFGGRGASGTGGWGLGLAISRTLAALHFSRLWIVSREGEGTQVSFALPAAGPASVADALVRWREISVAAGLPSPRAELGEGGESAVGQGEQRVLPFDGPRPRFPETAALVSLRVNHGPVELLARIEEVLQSDQRLHELVYRTDTSRWVMLWDNNLDEAGRRIASLDAQLRPAAGDAGFVWSEPLGQPVIGRAQQSRIRELLVRDSLQACSGPVLGHDRSGRTLDPSPESIDVATRRLEEELKRLSGRLARQTDQLQSQADRLAAALR